MWMSSQPLWRIGLAEYGLLVLVTYVASWASNRSPQQPGNSAFFHFSFPAVMTAGQLLAIHFRRRRVDRTPTRRLRSGRRSE